MPESMLRDDVYADVLVGTVDDIRREIRAALGTRPYAVAIITRTWSGATVSDGTPTDTVLELDPAPMVEEVGKDRMGPSGREGAGDLVLTEVSLKYSEAELEPPVDERTEVAYRVREAQGQGQRDRYFVLAGSPIPRRGNKTSDRSDWRLVLRATTDLGPLDSTST